MNFGGSGLPRPSSAIWDLNDKVGEASFRIAKEINTLSTPYNRPVSDLKVTYLMFPDTADKPFGPPDLEKLQARSKTLVKEIGGANVALHHWENVIRRGLRCRALLPKETASPTPTPWPTSSPLASPTFAFPHLPVPVGGDTLRLIRCLRQTISPSVTRSPSRNVSREDGYGRRGAPQNLLEAQIYHKMIIRDATGG